MKVTAADLVAAFHDAGRCTNGTATPCSYTNELETLACDPTNGALYIVNTVNDPKLNPPVDKQAMFKIRKAGNAIVYDGWHPLSPGIKNRLAALVVIQSKLYGGGGKALVEYDYEKQDYAELDARNNPRPVYTAQQGNIVGLGYEAPYLWVLTDKKQIVKVDWDAKTDVGVWDVESVPGVKLGLAKGLEAVSGELYVVDGDAPHKIFVLRMK